MITDYCKKTKELRKLTKKNMKMKILGDEVFPVLEGAFFGGSFG